MEILTLARAAGADGEFRKPQIHATDETSRVLIARAAKFLGAVERG